MKRFKTPDSVWSVRMDGEFLGFPVCSGDEPFTVDKSGKVCAVATADTLQLLGTNPLNELCQSTPAIAGGRVFVRTWSQLHCIGAK